MATPPKWKMAKLDRREAVATKQLQDAIKAARQRVAKVVHAAAREKGILVSGRNREALYKRIGDIYLELDNGLKDWGKDLIRKTAVDWHDSAIKDITGQTGLDPRNSVTRFSREYAEDVFKRVHPTNGRSLAAVLTDKMAESDKKALREAVTVAYREAALSGGTMNEIAGAIRDKWDRVAGDMSAMQFVDSAGRPWENGRYLQMVVRTTVARVSRDSYFETLTKNGDDLAVIQNADGEACDICQAWDEVIISITGASGDYPSHQQALNAGWGHPNCRCMAERVDETVDSEAIKQQAETETPDLTRQRGETGGEYRARVTEAMADYSADFG